MNASKIIDYRLCVTSTRCEFAELVKGATEELQRQGLAVEVQFANATAGSGDNYIMVYSALLIGRRAQQ